MPTIKIHNRIKMENLSVIILISSIATKSQILMNLFFHLKWKQLSVKFQLQAVIARTILMHGQTIEDDWHTGFQCLLKF